MGTPSQNIGTASGDSLASGVGNPLSKAIATGPGIANASSIGQSRFRVPGTAPGVANASAVGKTVRLTTGTAPGVANASAVGKGIGRAIATTAGTSSAVAEARSSAKSVGTAGGTSVAAAATPSTGVSGGGIANASSWAACRKTQKFKLSSSGISRQACSIASSISKATVLAMMPSVLDKTKAIVLETGEVISLESYTDNQIRANIRNKVWVYYETKMPRRMFLTNPNWSVTSFDPRTRNVCVQIETSSGSSVINITA